MSTTPRWRVRAPARRDAELHRIIRSGLSDPSIPLPLVAPAPEPVATDGDADGATGRRRVNRRRMGGD